MFDFSATTLEDAVSSQIDLASDPALAEVETKRLIVFQVAEQYFAFDAEIVSEIIRPPEVTPLPGTPNWVLGIANVRGEIVTVLSLRRLWSLHGGDNSNRSKMIVLGNKPEFSQVAVAVDRVFEVFSPEVSKLTDADSPIEQVRKCFNHRNSVVNVVDSDALASVFLLS